MNNNGYIKLEWNDPIWLSLSIFFASSAWYLSISRRTKKSTNTSLSTRANKTIEEAPPAYMQGFLEALKNPCEPMANPEGYIALCVAENTLVTEKMASRLMQPSLCITAFSNSTVYNYNSFLGLPVAREAVANFLSKFFAPDKIISGENVVLGSGAGGLLNHLFFALADSNDAVLIPAPYYAKFDNDMSAIANLIPIPVHSIDPTKPNSQDFDNARLVLKYICVTSKHNPHS